MIRVETINAGDGDDVIYLTSPTFDMADVNMTINGEEGNDTLWAAEGHDILNGGAGDDILFGGAGTNVFNGGTGADEFQFTTSSTNDSVTDFNVAKGDTLTFFATGGAEFDESSVLANYALNGITIQYSLKNQTQSLDISLGSETWNRYVLRDVISSVEIT